MDSSWLIGLVAWAAFTAGLSAGLLAFASLEARKTRYKKYPASLSDFEEDSEHFEDEPYLSDIYETMPDEYKIKDEKKMKKEAHADSITDSMKETSSIYSSPPDLHENAISKESPEVNDHVVQVVICLPPEETSEHHHSNYFKLPEVKSRKISLSRSASQNRADYL